MTGTQPIQKARKSYSKFQNQYPPCDLKHVFLLDGWSSDGYIAQSLHIYDIFLHDITVVKRIYSLIVQYKALNRIITDYLYLIKQDSAS